MPGYLVTKLVQYQEAVTKYSNHHPYFKKLSLHAKWENVNKSFTHKQHLKVFQSVNWRLLGDKEDNLLKFNFYLGNSYTCYLLVKHSFQ